MLSGVAQKLRFLYFTFSVYFSSPAILIHDIFSRLTHFKNDIAGMSSLKIESEGGSAKRKIRNKSAVSPAPPPLTPEPPKGYKGKLISMRTKQKQNTLRLKMIPLNPSMD